MRSRAVYSSRRCVAAAVVTAVGLVLLVAPAAAAPVPDSATSGSYLVDVADVVRDARSFTATTGLGFTSDDNDVYKVGGSALAGGARDFYGLLSSGDRVDVQYASDPGQVSVFDLVIDVVYAPLSITAELADHDGDLRPDGRLRFELDPRNGSATYYVIEVRRAHGAGADGICGNVDDPGPQEFEPLAALSSSFNTPTYWDVDLPVGCRHYRITTGNVYSWARAETERTASLNVPWYVTGDPMRVDWQTPRTCLAGIPPGATVDVSLVPAELVVETADGLFFRDADGDGVLGGTAVAPDIVSIDGFSVDSDQATAIFSDGELEVVLAEEDDLDDVVVVVHDDSNLPNHSVDLGDARSDGLRRATEAVVAGCATSFGPPRATTGTVTIEVASTHPTSPFFIGTDGLAYLFDPSDTFAWRTRPFTGGIQEFRGVLTAGDVVRVVYDSRPEGQSQFDLLTDAVAAPSKVDAELVTGGDGRADDIRLVFTPPTVNRGGTRYVIERRSSQHPGPDLRCGTDDDMLLGKWTWIGFEPHEGSDGRYRDHDVSVGCHQYRIIARNPATGTSTPPVYASSGVERPVLT